MLYYLGIADLPGRKAHSIQEMRMCEAFAEAGETVVYVHGHRFGERPKVTWDDVADHYGLETRFEIRTFRNLRGKTGRFTKVGTLSMAGPQAAYVLARLLARRCSEADVVFGRNYYPLYFLAEVLTRLPVSKRPGVYFENHDPLDKRFESRFYSRIDGVVSTTAGLAEHMVEQYPITHERIFVEPNGVDRRPYEELTRVRARERLGLPLDDDLVVYTGHLYPDKGGEVLVEAARELDATVSLVGGYEEDIERVKRNAGEPANVTFTGFVEPAEIPPYQVAADVLVAPHTSAAPALLSPLKLFEYLAAARPIVASNWGTIPEVMTDGETALLFEPGDAEALSGTIERALSDSKLSQTLAANADAAADHHRWERRAERVLSFLRDGGQ